jgi:hypothetical protein
MLEARCSFYWNPVTNIKKTLNFLTLLKYYATSRKVAVSNPDEVIGFLTRPNPSSRTTAVGSTELLTEISTRNISGGKGRPARKADNLTTIV